MPLSTFKAESTELLSPPLPLALSRPVVTRPTPLSSNASLSFGLHAMSMEETEVRCPAIQCPHSARKEREVHVREGRDRNHECHSRSRIQHSSAHASCQAWSTARRTVSVPFHPPQWGFSRKPTQLCTPWSWAPTPADPQAPAMILPPRPLEAVRASRIAYVWRQVRGLPIWKGISRLAGPPPPLARGGIEALGG